MGLEQNAPQPAHSSPNIDQGKKIYLILYLPYILLTFSFTYNKMHYVILHVQLVISELDIQHYKFSQQWAGCH
jgi:hypothetical protein